MHTACGVATEGVVPADAPLSSRVVLGCLGLLKALKMSELERFTGRALDPGFTADLDVVAFWPKDEVSLFCSGLGAGGAAAFFGSSVRALEAVDVGFGVAFVAGFGGSGKGIGGLGPVLRCGFIRTQGSGVIGKIRYLDCRVLDDPIVSSRCQRVFLGALHSYLSVTVREDLEVLAASALNCH